MLRKLNSAPKPHFALSLLVKNATEPVLFTALLDIQKLGLILSWLCGSLCLEMCIVTSQGLSKYLPYCHVLKRVKILHAYPGVFLTGFVQICYCLLLKFNFAPKYNNLPFVEKPSIL